MAATCLLSSGFRGAVAASLRLSPRASGLSPRASGCLSPRASGCLSSGLRMRFVSVAAEGGTGPMIEESTAEYEFVERLIPPTQVPTPPPHDGPTPSGWCPPAASPPDLPYMVRRSRMHNVPVYRDTTHANRHMTVLRKIQGDIWALERDVRLHLKEITGIELPTQVNEVTMTIKVKGHFDQELKDWLLKKGF